MERRTSSDRSGRCEYWADYPPAPQRSGSVAAIGAPQPFGFRQWPIVGLRPQEMQEPPQRDSHHPVHEGGHGRDPRKDENCGAKPPTFQVGVEPATED